METRSSDEVRIKLIKDITKTRTQARESGLLIELLSGMIESLPADKQLSPEVHVSYEIVKFEVEQRQQRLAFLLSVQEKYYPKDYEHDNGITGL